MVRDDLVLVKSVRTPIGKFQGGLSHLSPKEMGIMVVSDLLEQTGIDPAIVDGIIVGWAAQDYTSADIAREVGLAAGLPDTVIGTTVHRNCGTGMEALDYARIRVKAGAGDVYIVGGFESLSRIPRSISRGVDSQKDLMGHKEDHDPLWGGLTDPHAGIIMGGVANYAAYLNDISKEEQDQFAVWSHQRAFEGRDRLLEEMVSQEVLNTLPIQRDEGVRKNLTLENLGALLPHQKFADDFIGYVKRTEGEDSNPIATVTPGNASQISDGGIAALVMSERKAKELGLEPLTTIRAVDVTALEAVLFPMAPAYSMMNVIERANRNTRRKELKFEDISLFEINEAFAVVPIATQRVLAEKGYDLNLEHVNVNGGSCALGHPIAMTGLRIVTTVAYEMERRGERYGMASICQQGGMGGTTLLERK